MLALPEITHRLSEGLAPSFRELSVRRFRRAVYCALAVRRSGTEEGSLGLRWSHKGASIVTKLPAL